MATLYKFNVFNEYICIFLMFPRSINVSLNEYIGSNSDIKGRFWAFRGFLRGFKGYLLKGPKKA